MKKNFKRYDSVFVVDFNESNSLTVKQGMVRDVVLHVESAREKATLENTRLQVRLANKKGTRLLGGVCAFESREHATAAMHYALATNFRGDLRGDKVERACSEFREKILTR